MNKIKLVLPFALCAVTLASCDKSGKGLTDITLLNRVNYRTANSFYDLTDTFDKMHEAQFPENEETEEVDDDRLPFQLSKQGTATVQYYIKASGTIKMHYVDYYTGIVLPVNFNNLDIALSNTITASWDLDKGYLKIANKEDSYYLGCEQLDDDNYQYYRYHNSKIKDKNYKTPVYYKDEWSSYEEFTPAFTDAILIETAKNFSLPLPVRYATMIDADDAFSGSVTPVIINPIIGFDLSGYRNVPFQESETPPFPSYYSNALSFGTYLSDPEIAFDIDTFLSINPITQLTAKCASNNDTTASVEVKLSETDLQEYSSLIEVYTGIRTAGKVSLDYFLAFADSRVKQQELVFDVKDASLLGALPTYYNPYNEYVINTGAYIIDARDINIAIHANEDVTDKCETVDTYDKNNYVPLMPL